MRVVEYIFVLSCLVVFYNYAGYAILALIFNSFKSKKTVAAEPADLPSVSFIVAAFNEEECIRQKLINSLELDYPKEKIEFIFITDGSTDGSMDIIRSFQPVKLMHSETRKGKTAAVNRAVIEAANDILIFSDANTILNKEAVQKITRHYSDKKVGGVAGEKKVLSIASSHEVGAGEGMYWRYESFLKKLDSDFYSVVGAAGELFSLRRAFYVPIPEAVILDDFIISMKVAQKGYRVIYEPGAIAMELPSYSLPDEQKRKIRIAAGGFQSIGILGSLLLFWKQPRLSFLYISHRLLRWTLTPICLITALVSNGILFFGTTNPVFRILFIIQICFYLLAVIVNALPDKMLPFRALKLPYYFVFMNVSVIQGFFRFLRGRQPATWEKAKRSAVQTSV
jgi:cellulose synthase/poly-beta-1,6-N-acetylglucosamine synthase-like glycosyltransferase